jgi:pSer/pThr/pTyr-binding forkhead associated (FHA) protein
MNLAAPEPQGGSLTLPGGREERLRPDLTIGRGPDNDIVLRSKTVSRSHAMLTFRDGRWFIQDRGSANGTFVSNTRIPFGVPHPLRHADTIGLGSERLVFSWPAEAADPDRTDALEEPSAEIPVQLSSFQLQIVRALCGAWVGGDELDELPSNEQIAEQLGTPDAAGSVKAGLRRIYAKAGLSELPPHTKRRMLCRIARQQGWL